MKPKDKNEIEAENRERKAPKTRENYRGHAARFARFNSAPDTSPEEKICAYLSRGGVIHDLKKLMGHTSIKTTERYLKCVPNLASRAISPIDDFIIPFRKSA